MALFSRVGMIVYPMDLLPIQIEKVSTSFVISKMIPLDHHGCTWWVLIVRRGEGDLWIRKGWTTVEVEFLEERNHLLSLSCQWLNTTNMAVRSFSLHASIFYPGHGFDVNKARFRRVHIESWCGYIGPSTIQVGDPRAVNVQLGEKEKYRAKRSSWSILRTSRLVDEMTLERFGCEHRFYHQEIHSLRVWNGLWVLSIVSPRRPFDATDWLRSFRRTQLTRCILLKLDQLFRREGGGSRMSVFRTKNYT